MKNMKKIKLFITALLFCTIGVIGYVTYEKCTMIKVGKFMLANIEALTSDESGGGAGTCGSYGWTGDSYAIVCHVSKTEAMENYNWWNTPYKGWCCDSCNSTWYCGQ